MRLRRWMVLGAFLISGCAEFEPLISSEPVASTEALAPRVDANVAPRPTSDEVGLLPIVEAQVRPVAPTPAVLSPTSKVETEVAPVTRLPTIDPLAVTVAAVEESPDLVPASPPVIEAATEVARPPLPTRPKGGRAVAKVGGEIITLPELTEAVKARLTQLGPDANPSRRQVIAIARSVLKGMIVESLVIQEATEKLGPDRVEETKARIERTWNSQEWPAMLRREGVSNESELRRKLANSLNSPESFRGQFLVRSLAEELMRLDGPLQDFDAYVDGLRRRRPIVSIMSPAELAVAGRKAAQSGGAER